MLSPKDSNEIKKIMREIKVDPYGIKIMSPKALPRLVRLNRISNIAANILKQEMLSLGADAAIARTSLTGSAKFTDCLLIGNSSQFNQLNQKLKLQPFGLKDIAKDLFGAFKNYEKSRFILDLGRFRLNLSSRAHIMGILNVTPDSFSADGIYRRPQEAISLARKQVEDGCVLILVPSCTDGVAGYNRVKIGVHRNAIVPCQAFW